MSNYLIRRPQGFPLGYTAITEIGEAHYDTGIAFGILKLKAGETYTLQSPYESALLLMQGQCDIQFNHQHYIATRESCFNDSPITLHLCTNHHADIHAIDDCEFALMQTVNTTAFTSMIYDANNILENEQRGKDILNDTAHRIVRTIFDIRNSPQAKLVLGEVINAPGRWSSYPPHHHAQPEIYHYRFTEAQGYGHAECGDDVFKVRQFDTYKILDEKDHPQAAAPGYGMYYIWVIRHLDNQPYSIPIFNEAHSWTKSAEANQRVWNGGLLP